MIKFCVVFTAMFMLHFGSANSVYLLSYPRSGQTWFLNCIQFLTNRCVMKMNEYPYRNSEHYFKTKKNRRTDDLLMEYLDFDKEVIYHGHKPSLFLENRDASQLIVLQRNYREAVIRNLKQDASSSLSEEVNKYVQILKTYESWKGSPKLIISYEDLIVQPKPTLLKVLRFLGESEEKLEEFLENIEGYKMQVLAAYQNTHKHVGGSMSKGEDLLYHTKTSPKKLVNTIDEKVKVFAGEHLWNRYLECYFVM